MTSQKITILGSLVVAVLALLWRYVQTVDNVQRPQNNISSPLSFTEDGQSTICGHLAQALPGVALSRQHPDFYASLGSYWSMNAREAIPACILRVKDIRQISTALSILQTEHVTRNNDSGHVRFSVKSGGHSPEMGFAGVQGGVLIDLGLLDQVTLASDQQTVRVGVGARWRKVYSELAKSGLAIVGGRNANVGVGGLVLGGGVSFFSPKYGMVCDNIDEYEIVLANGTITNVSSVQHPDLWRALKGGSGNFGIVTSIVARPFVVGDIWAGYAFWPIWQTSKVLEAFVDFNQPENFNEFAAGPIFCIVYVQMIRLPLLAASLVYTKPQPWAPVFDKFKSPWRVWSTLKITSLSDAAQEMDVLAPSGRRQFQATMTFVNDLETAREMGEAYRSQFKRVNQIKGSIWSFVLQPLSATVTHKGSPNALGLETRQQKETLIVVLIAAAWKHKRDDEAVHAFIREMLLACESIALKKGTLHPYQYLNYAASGQDPFRSYGEENLAFLKRVSREYDPSQFFQHAKSGGLKLVDS